VKRKNDPSTIELEVETSGGKNGGAVCTYEINGFYGGQLSETGESIHRQALTEISAGVHTIAVSCDDEVNPVVTEELVFEMQIDNTNPKVTRIYEGEGKLFVVTDEVAECSFSTETCQFNVDDAGNGEVKLMSIVSGSGGFIHRTDFEVNEEYKIKCEDSVGNRPVGCTISAKGSDVGN